MKSMPISFISRWLLGAGLLGLELLGLGLVGSSCTPSPCDQLVDTWMTCWCEGATPSTTRPQSSIDEACASPQAFVDSPVTLPDPEQQALARCDDDDAVWAEARINASECREGGAYVCGGSDPSACYPPE